jgi:hypothetical protein
MPDPLGDEFLGETLFHFLGSGSDERLLEVLDSIVQRGLLLTVGNKEGKLDVFKVHLVGGIEDTLEVMQHARVCFTDIPEKLLAGHSQEYGRFGLGFSRKTILEWGGNPVIYLPNHPDPTTLESSMAVLLYCLHRVPLLTAALRACIAPGNASLTINEKTLTGEARDDYIDLADHSVQRILGFVKEMSSQIANDYRYLYEREWRIVDGAYMRGGKDPTRELSTEEYRELGAKCVRWTKPLVMSEVLSRKYPHTSMLQFFRFFDGLPGKTVSQAIEVILVPNDATKGKVESYIANHSESFRPAGPEVRVFGTTPTSEGLKLSQRRDVDAGLKGTAGPEVLKHASEDLLREHPVSTRVNKPGVGDDDATLIDRIPVNDEAALPEIPKIDGEPYDGSPI